MKKAFLFFLVALVLAFGFTAQSEARTVVRVRTNRTVTAPPIYWQYYNNYYAPMAARVYNSVPPALRPVRVVRPSYVPTYTPYGYPAQPGPWY